MTERALSFLPAERVNDGHPSPPRHTWLSAEDLAQGDQRSVRLDFAAMRVDEVRSPSDPLFAMAYGALAAQFGVGDALELPEVLAQRMTWTPEIGMRYGLFLVRDAAGEIAAVRDHTAIQSADGAGCTVHLSHLLIAPAWRRSGLAGWMRALPLVTARAFAQPLTLVAEMDGEIAEEAYARAGFLKADPARVQYYQPDFRPPAEIDGAGGPQPVPFKLLLRRVGREHERELAPGALRTLVSDLYRMYAQGCRSRDLPSLEGYPAEGDAPIRLLP